MWWVISDDMWCVICGVWCICVWYRVLFAHVSVATSRRAIVFLWRKLVISKTSGNSSPFLDVVVIYDPLDSLGLFYICTLYFVKMRVYMRHQVPSCGFLSGSCLMRKLSSHHSTHASLTLTITLHHYQSGGKCMGDCCMFSSSRFHHHSSSSRMEGFAGMDYVESTTGTGNRPFTTLLPVKSSSPVKHFPVKSSVVCMGSIGCGYMERGLGRCVCARGNLFPYPAGTAR